MGCDVELQAEISPFLSKFLCVLSSHREDPEVQHHPVGSGTLVQDLGKVKTIAHNYPHSVMRYKLFLNKK